jgi:hypothetical protein
VQGSPLISIGGDIVSSGDWESGGVEDFTPHALQIKISKTIALFTIVNIYQITFNDF